MNRRKFHLALFAILGSTLINAASADSKTITLASLEWPPYTGTKLPEQGASVAVAKAAFKAMGYELKVEFYPWSRAVQLGKSSPTHAGYFPEYDSADVRKDFHLSEPMGTGPLGLAQRVDAPFTWNSIADLSSKKVGVVQDYVNTTEFDARVAAKQQKVDVAIDDGKNLLKLGGGRLDLAVVDSNVFNYLMKTDAALKSYVGKLSMNAKILEDKKLFICFKKDAEGQRAAKIFNEGLKKIDVNALMKKQLGG
ncbi:substrate-binding periplasmic protein [Chitinimonas sp. BJB300]|uniref:substrate-binding periplasmic protein n=1 Tax=Chitinimonas sp. BJB300 TaxID=1559339 RepID=UPI000C119FB3|nr:ABC transporter substrate-binding protein [Chitinimonas sp. BJB300]PHV12533.1 ABC transporter [Chitinimonas sp. BJB300]TSJ91118.1 ABC transporter substrate-binding protein [Chitinimonas sp. BJB300]